MRLKKIDRLLRTMARLVLSPTPLIALTELAEEWAVSKTIVGSDLDVISDALQAEGLGKVQIKRGRKGGASFYPAISLEKKQKLLSGIASSLSSKERRLPSGLIYYNDFLCEPRYALQLGLALASEFAEVGADVVMTSEVKGIPLALFAAYALGVPLSICRYQNRPSDGSAVGVHFPSANGGIRTMYLGTRQLQKGSNVLIIDDFMRGGSTAAAMMLMAEEFKANVAGVGVFIVSDEPVVKAVPEYRSLLTLSHEEGETVIKVSK